MGEAQKASLTKGSESFFDQKPKNIKEMAETEVRMENIVLALLAHVDRGKTSLLEALLYESGRISEKGTSKKITKEVSRKCSIALFP